MPEDETLDLGLELNQEDQPVEPIIGDPGDEHEEVEESQPATPAAITRDDVYQYLQNDPDELQRIARIANAALEDNNTRAAKEKAPAQPVGPIKRPKLSDFRDESGNIYVEDYDEAIDAYEQSREVTSYAVLAPVQVTNEASSIASKFDVPETAMGELREALQMLTPQQLMSLTDGDRAFIARAAEGLAAQRSRVSQSKVQKPHTERAGSVSQGTWKPAPGQTKGDVDFYCSITGRDINNKADREYLKKEGLIV